MKRCSKCDNLMPNDVTHCIRCGYDSAAKAAPAASPQPPAFQVAPAAGKGGKIRNGWALAKQSWRVLAQDKQLLVFPLASGVSCILVLAGFVAAIWASGVGEDENAASGAIGWLVLFAYYFANYFVIVFFNSALVACAMARLRGGNPTARDGLRVARERVAQIAAWALFAATVGVVLRMIESRSEFVGRLVTSLLGGAFTLGTYFVVPVLVAEKLGPYDAFKRSLAIIKKAWGESIVANTGLGIVTFLAMLVLVIPTGFLAAVLALKVGSFAVALAGMAAVAALMILTTLVGSALSSIALASLYLFATGERVTEAFSGAAMQQAFARK
jgi:hypothetical protein